MKPFDLENYKKNPSRELITRGGQKARIICTDRVIDKYKIVALIQFRDREIIQSYTELGYVSHGHTDTLDLFFASVKHKGWINIYKDKQGFRGQRIFETEECAKNAGFFITGYVDTIPVEWEE